MEIESKTKKQPVFEDLRNYTMKIEFKADEGKKNEIESELNVKQQN